MQNSKVIILFQFVERFIFYSLLSVLAFYLLSLYNDDTTRMFSTYSSFSFGLYLAPLAFSLFADFLGRKYFAIGGYLLLSIGLFLLSINSFAQNYTAFILIIIVIGIASIKPNLVVFLIDSLRGNDANKIIFRLVLFFGVIDLAVTIAPLFSQTISNITSYDYTYVTIILGFIAFFSFAILMFVERPTNHIKEENSKTFVKYNPKVIIIITSIAFIIALGNEFSNQLYQIANDGDTKMLSSASNLIGIIWLGILLVLLKFIKIKNYENFIYKIIVASIIFYAFKYIYVFLYGNNTESMVTVFVIFELLQLFFSTIFIPVLYYLFQNSFLSRFKTFGVALLSVVLIFPSLLKPVTEIARLWGLANYTLILGCGLIVLVYFIYKYKEKFIGIVREST